MRVARWTLSCGAAVLAIACSSRGGSGAPPEGGPDTGNDALDSPAGDAGDGSTDDSEAQAPQALLRIANVSPDAPPLDVCVALHGTATFQGPLVGQLAAGGNESDGGDAGGAETETDAAPPGVAYPQVSAYIGLTPGDYDVRIVAAGATACDAPLVSDFAGLPPLAVATSTTLLVAGDFLPAGNDAPLTVAMLTDDAALSGGAVALRAIDAVPSQPALDFGLGFRPGVGASPDGRDVRSRQPPDRVGRGRGRRERVHADCSAPVPGDEREGVGAGRRGGPGRRDRRGDRSRLDRHGHRRRRQDRGPGASSGAAPCVDNQPSGGLLSDCSVAH